MCLKQSAFLSNYWPLLTLAILAFIIHLAFLSYPAQVVFDEVHFGKFVSAYFTGQYYFDIHPPLGKLIIAGWAKLNSVNPVFDFDHIGEAVPAHTLFVLRFMPAFFGALFVLAFSWLAYLISRSKIAALIAGFLILLDNAFLVQSRFILVDIFMLFFGALTFGFFFLYQRQKSFSKKWFIYLILTGIFLGLTISIKWTGLAAIGIIGVVLLAKVFSKKLTVYLNQTEESSPKLPLTRGEKKKALNEGFAAMIVLLSIGFIVYAAPFAIHFKLLPNSGPGDAFMSSAFQRELKYGQDSIEQPLTFWQKFTELNHTMFTANAGITGSHPYGSRWYSWPLDSKPIYYWNQDQTEGRAGWIAKIYFAGNPLLWWLAAGFIAFTLIKIFARKETQRLEPINYILLLGYFANLLPFVLIARVSFLYHYLPAAFFAILLTAVWLASFWSRGKKIVIAILVILALGFVLATPFSYGLPIPSSLASFGSGFLESLAQ